MRPSSSIIVFLIRSFHNSPNLGSSPQKKKERAWRGWHAALKLGACRFGWVARCSGAAARALRWVEHAGWVERGSEVRSSTPPLPTTCSWEDGLSSFANRPEGICSLRPAAQLTCDNIAGQRKPVGKSETHWREADSPCAEIQWVDVWEGGQPTMPECIFPRPAKRIWLSFQQV